MTPGRFLTVPDGGRGVPSPSPKFGSCVSRAGPTRWKVRHTVKVKPSVKRICNACRVIRRHGRVMVICKADPRHKQRQG